MQKFRKKMEIMQKKKKILRKMQIKTNAKF